ncbi:PilW family protein [Hydrogenophaga sp.]|uniref:PilW family protein n=1 Tax=Hydrogenophaga sp. TaxID=1904254 RepID=UPI00272778CF|nr:PilW family protein [Hydrogenophaga sp.]MDO8903743.1 PilW family protein [Hydrogenophaga sp.]
MNAHRQRGLTLIELLVSIAIGLIILLAIGTVYVNSNNLMRQREDQTQLNEPARIATGILHQNLVQAGFVDIFDLNAANRAQASAIFIPGNEALTNLFLRNPAVAPVSSPISTIFAGLTPVFGCDGAMTSTPNAILTAGAPAVQACGAANATRHSLQIAYQAIPNDAANAANSLIAANPAVGVGVDCLQQNVPAGTTFVINRFFVEVPAAEGIPQLRCAGSGNNQAQSMAPGVEEFILRYQMSAPGAPGAAVAAGGGQAQYVSAAAVAASVQGWSAVTAVEICIVSATDATRGAAAQGTTVLQPTRPTCQRNAAGGFAPNIARAAGDNRLWKRFTSVVSLRNAVYATPL